MSVSTDLNSAQKAELLESFLLDSWDALSQFEGITFGLEDPKSLKDLAILTHRLRGTAALYGFEQISKLSELMEQILERSDRFSHEHLPKLQTLFQQFAACLSRSLEQISLSGQEGQVGIQFTAVGGAKLLAELLRESPELFVIERSNEQRKSSSLSQELKTYYRNHQEDWSFFAPEAEETIETLGFTLDDAHTKDLSDHSSVDEIINTLFRSTHTLKGAAYMVGLDPMGDLAHQLEEIMVRVRDGELSFDQEVLSALQEGNTALALMLDTARGNESNLEAKLNQTQAKIQSLLGLEPSSSEQLSGRGTNELSEHAAFEAYFKDYYQNNQDVWEYFEPEVSENLAASESALLSLSDNLEDDEALHTIFRAMHTLKGAAYMVEFEAFGHLAADLEKLSRLVQEGDLVLDDELIFVFDKGLQVLASLMRLAEGKNYDGPAQVISLHAVLQPYLTELLSASILAPSHKATTLPETESSQPAASLPSNQGQAVERKNSSMVRVSSDKLDALMDIAGEVLTLRNRMNQQLEQLADLNELMAFSRNRMLKTVSEFEEQYLNPQMSAQTNKEDQGEKQNKRGIASSLQDVFDELEFDTYSDLNILARSVSEMSHDVSEIQEQLNDFFNNVTSETDQLQSLSRQLRSEISRARMVPISQLYGLLKRLLKNSSDKAYRLETSGENVELDNTVLESVSDSLLHLVRNALVHGIESQEERLAKGKDAEGKINLRAYPQGSHVYIEVQDDGAGIDVEALKQKAVERGFRSQEEVDKLSLHEAQQLIFIAGLSTAESLSTTAGRGVGMDAVADAVKRLNGEISLVTELGKGTRFSLKLPLTLLISDALMVEVAEQSFGFVSDNIETLQTLRPDEIELINGSRHIRYQNETLELHDVRALLGFEQAGPKKDHTLVIVKTESKFLAFEVDKHLDLEEIVVRKLNPALTQLSHISNATIAPSGDVVLIFDPIGLANLNIDSVRQQRQPIKRKSEPKNLKILLVDDSVSVRRVISKMLGRAQYDVNTAGDGQEALERFLQGEHFDMVLSDLEMPRMNGYELLEELRRRPDSKDTPIVIMTTRAGDKHRKLALELGANAYFSKPIDENKLIHAIKELSA